MKEAYIIAAKRTAVGRAIKGKLAGVRSDYLAKLVIQNLMEGLPDLNPDLVDDLIVGCANPEGEQGLQMGRQIALQAIGKEVPGITINRYCASGLEAVAMASSKITAGFGSMFLAGGAESMSMIPMTGYKLVPSYDVALEYPDNVVSMGITAEAVAKKYEISRDAQDQFAYESHIKAAKALADGAFKDQIVPVEVKEVYVEDDTRKERSFVFDTDEGVRTNTSLEALAKLRPVFANNGSVTAGNSSQTSDGASFLLVVSEDVVKEHNLKPIARLLSCAVAGVDPLYMGIGPVKAIPMALKQANLSLGDIDLIELNEAFAAQSLAVIQEAELNPEIVNVNGGAIALGHPLGCTGAKLSTQIIYELQRRNKRYGMVTACVGGGMGIAGIIEKL